MGSSKLGAAYATAAVDKAPINNTPTSSLLNVPRSFGDPPASFSFNSSTFSEILIDSFSDAIGFGSFKALTLAPLLVKFSTNAAMTERPAIPYKRTGNKNAQFTVFLIEIVILQLPQHQRRRKMFVVSQIK